MHIELHTRRAKTAAEIYSSVTQRILPSISPRESFRFPRPSIFLSEYKSQVKIREGKRGERAMMSRYHVFEISASRCRNSDTNNPPCESGRKIYPPHSNFHPFLDTMVPLRFDRHNVNEGRFLQTRSRSYVTTCRLRKPALLFLLHVRRCEPGSLECT